MLEQNAQMKTLYFNIVARAQPDEGQVAAVNVAKTLE